MKIIIRPTMSIKIVQPLWVKCDNGIARGIYKSLCAKEKRQNYPRIELKQLPTYLRKKANNNNKSKYTVPYLKCLWHVSSGGCCLQCLMTQNPTLKTGLLIFRGKKSKISRDFRGQIRGKISRNSQKKNRPISREKSQNSQKNRPISLGFSSKKSNDQRCLTFF